MAVKTGRNRYINLPTLTYHHQVEPSGASETRGFFRRVAIALRAGVALDVDTQTAAAETHPTEAEGSLIYKLRSSVPLNGFQRTDVSRLVLTFGRLEDVVPVQLGLFLEPVSQSGQMQEAWWPVDSPAVSDPS